MKKTNQVSLPDEHCLIPDELNDPSTQHYIFVQYYEPKEKRFLDKPYSYKSHLQLKVGDFVEVERGSERTLGIVTDIQNLRDENAPYPYEKLKEIIRKIEINELEK